MTEALLALQRPGDGCAITVEPGEDELLVVFDLGFDSARTASRAALHWTIRSRVSASNVMRRP